jgi:uncharacterized SAM-binding protein YcdF (DUF218 family)
MLSGAAAGAGVAVALWLIGWVWFASTLPTTVADETVTTDAIVVWTGGSGRIDEGLNLLEAGRAERLFISGASERVQVSDLLRGRLQAGELEGKISLGRAAIDTPGNAAETAQWALRENVRSLRLVTAAYHMRRSLLELEAAMPQATVVPHPVFPATVKPDWWRWPGTATLIASEYTKYVLAAARIGVGWPEGSSVEAAGP